MIPAGELIQLVSPKGKRYLRSFDPSEEVHTHDGTLRFSETENLDFGSTLHTHLGRPYRILKPTLYDILKGIKRKTQILYPKDIGYIMVKLGIGPGSHVIEAGSGSGSMTTALSWFVRPNGLVYTYERREDFYQLCAKNLKNAGLNPWVLQFNQDIELGFVQKEVQAAFIDLRTPWDYLSQVADSVLNGAPVGFLLPTVNQVSELLRALENSSFSDFEVMEILLRKYKPVPDRLRPEDQMVGHTGFLVFARTNK